MKHSKEHQRVVALDAEARRRGMSYGQYMAATTEFERQQVLDRSKGSKLPLDLPHHQSADW